MPIIKSAKKKMRKDKRITAHNKVLKDNLKALIKSMRKTPTKQNLQGAFSALDKAAKTHLIHPNKASRLKSRLSKHLSA
ncbi:MAG: hypothetical protein ACD_30C00050G0001 [uncultured bacterium]|uniref:Small ribosomal subunit protein bS20 n=2 Tax=Candidatus Daviesiibacteriota TaxID=1752718 RepID=A0A1F5K7E3_9BACT|nr:MAG: hypothetical protein ACD_30C00050G0001 [uncultured bacterium]KKQ16252.1 MAG: 30S ribosomal protein S20 [Candidatus Daviesbacteria bacterium GW2011_GWA1_36_8]OGE33120.1 MAG: hypothetical protein A3C99_03785 [Candidatus Daviesbacteria bacterium RIFCSPHIGHO2_02_FULL_37_9]OGE36718.1 MAG: hypothetical protein A3E66_02185 [Candidatus Daviesbacteria bacterium RIFCSPHIGHO2_12_FULL_37_16]